MKRLFVFLLLAVLTDFGQSDRLGPIDYVIIYDAYGLWSTDFRAFREFLEQTFQPGSQESNSHNDHVCVSENPEEYNSLDFWKELEEATCYSENENKPNVDIYKRAFQFAFSNIFNGSRDRPHVENVIFCTCIFSYLILEFSK